MNEQERHDCEGVENSADIDDAWVRLILTRHAPSVGGWLRSRYAILTAEDVEDIVVIAMIRLWKVRDRFDAARASLRTYFARIADNVARSLISSGWAKARLLEVPLHMREIAAASNDDLRDQAPQDASLMRKLGQALSQLPEAYRTILLADACAGPCGLGRVFVAGTANPHRNRSCLSTSGRDNHTQVACGGRLQSPMSKPIQQDPEFPEHRWLVDQIAKLAGPRELTAVSDAELEAMLEGHAETAYSVEEIERLAARFWSEVSQPPVPPTTLPIDDASLPVEDAWPNTPLPPSSPVLGFLGNLNSLGGLTRTLWSLLILVSGMLLTLAVVVVTIRSTHVGVEVHEVAKAEGGVPRPSASNPSSSPESSSQNIPPSVAQPAAAQPSAASYPSVAAVQAPTSA